MSFEILEKQLADDLKGTFVKRASDTNPDSSPEQVMTEVTLMLAADISTYVENFWAEFGGGGGGVNLSDLHDVSLSSLAINDVLSYNGDVWVNIPRSSLGGGKVDSVSVDGWTYTPDENKNIALPVFRSTSLQRSLLPIIQPDGVMEINRYLDFHYDRQFSNDYDTRISIDDNRKLEIDATNGISIHDSTSQILNTSGGSLYVGGNTSGLVVLENNNSDYAHAFVVKNQNIPNESGTAYIWHSSNTYYRADNTETCGLNTQTIDLTAGSTELFYPCIVESDKLAWECEIHSKSLPGSHPWNQNYIKFTLFSQGWSDLSPMFTIHNYSYYEASERTIGGICRGTQSGSCCVYLRGGMYYNVISSRNITPHLSDVTIYGQETYNVGSNSTNAGNNVSTVWRYDENLNRSKKDMTMFDNVVINEPLLCYAANRNSNRAAIIIDKPGSYYSGIGSSGDMDRIYFGACNEQGNWQSYWQEWYFKGRVAVEDGIRLGNTNNIGTSNGYMELGSSGNEIVISGSPNMWVNYRGSGFGKQIPSEWYWGSGGAQANAIHRAGQFLASGEVAAGSSSDERLKCNFSYPDYAQRLLDMGRVRDYYFNDIAKKRTVRQHDDLQHTGFIYQKVIGVMPEMCEEDTDGYGRLNYIKPKYINTMAGAIQQNTLGIRSIQSRTEVLEQKVATLEKRLSRYENI